MAEIWGIAIAGGLGAAATVYSASQRPGAPTPRNLQGELNGISSQFTNFQNQLTGGQGFGANSLNQINSLNRGSFNRDAYVAAHGDRVDDFNRMMASGELNAGWTLEDFARQFGDTSQFYGGGLPEVQSNLITDSRTNNLNDVSNLAGAYNSIMRGSNPEYYNQLNRFTQAANAPRTANASQTQAADQARGGFDAFNPSYGTLATPGAFDTSGLMANTSFTNREVNGPSTMLGVNSRDIFSQSSNPVLDRLNQQALTQGTSDLQTKQNALANQLLDLGGQLSPDELRTVQQSSRAGFAARGLDATNASVVDETQSTLAAQRQRMIQNLGLAQGVQNQGMTERGQQQQFGLGVSNQNYGYNQALLGAQQANQGANLAAQQSNQGAFTALNAQQLSAQQGNQTADMQRQGLGLQAQKANQDFTLGGYSASNTAALGAYNANVGAQQGAYGLNLSNQNAQQQALTQSAALAEQQRQFDLNAQLQAVSAQAQGRLDPYTAILNGTDSSGVGNLLNLYGMNQSTQGNLLNGLLGYGGDLNNTNFNAAAAANNSAANNNAALLGAGLGALGQVGGAYFGGGMGGATGRPSGPGALTGAGGWGGTGGYLSGTFCWVAREVFGQENPRWLKFREWVLTRSPSEFRAYYLKHGPLIAGLVRLQPSAKPVLRSWMDEQIESLNPA